MSLPHWHYNVETRGAIMRCIQRLNTRESKALGNAMIAMGNGVRLPRPYVRSQLRAWFRLRWEYLVAEKERIDD